jgi:Uma2 family endonuclease
MHASIRKTMTPEQYLKQERKAPFKSEYLAGEIFAMAGASPRHVLITTNAAASFVSQLKGRQCFVFASDLRVKVSAGMLYTYPDIVIVCGMPRYEDRQKDTLLNPTALIEVLSDSTEAYDRGEKFAMYRSLKSLTDYLLISQSEPMIEHFSLGPNGPWALMDYREMGAVVPLPSIECTLPLADVYDKVVFDDQADLPMLRRIKEPEIEYITITRPRRPGDPRPTPDI